MTTDTSLDKYVESRMFDSAGDVALQDGSTMNVESLIDNAEKQRQYRMVPALSWQKQMMRETILSGGQRNRSGKVFAEPARKVLMDLWERVEKADPSFLTEVVPCTQKRAPEYNDCLLWY